jgi:hypothetical protein
LVLGLILTALVCGGCAANNGAAKTAKPEKARYITLEMETGSQLRRRVRVNPDGTISAHDSAVLRASPDVMQEVQRKGQAGRGPGGQ